jgi:hypothetical protein
MSLVSFYENHTPDHAGRRLEDVFAFSLDELEQHHDFIQWLFPLDTPSPVNPDAPTLNAQTIQSFRTTPRLQANLRRAFDLMLKFYGLQHSDGAIVRSPTFPERSRIWLRPMNHNHLRLTRILRSLHLLGLTEEARTLQAFLIQLAGDRPEAISPRTLHFWKTALQEGPA